MPADARDPVHVEGVFSTLLAEHGQTRMDDVWAAFRRFAEVEIGGTDPALGDLLCFEADIALLDETRRLLDETLSVGLRRQFSFLDDEGEYQSMAELGLSATVVAQAGWERLEYAVLWGVAGPAGDGPLAPLDPRRPDESVSAAGAPAWAAAVQAVPAFAVTLGSSVAELRWGYEEM